MNKIILPIFVISAIWFTGCASSQKQTFFIGEADTLSYFSIGSHNRISNARTDVELGVPIEGFPVNLNLGGNGFLTNRNIKIEKIKDIKYYELASRNEDIIDIEQIIKSVPPEFYEYDQLAK